MFLAWETHDFVVNEEEVIHLEGVGDPVVFVSYVDKTGITKLPALFHKTQS